jgi:hypothetical protein
MKLKTRQEHGSLRLSHGTWRFSCMYINAVANGGILYLWQDFYNNFYNQIIYGLRVRTPTH